MTEPQRRPRHLMDPDNLRRPVNDQSLTNVQRWVVSSLAVVTILHLSAGLVLAAIAMPDDQTVPEVGLCVIAGAFGVGAIMSWLAIHRRPLLTPWLLPGLLPTALGLWLVLR
ncbi:MAG TPA: hypothetical protein VGE38_05775 [Nocardioides sp.]|uniref:hypothetical protein n=1 Tax=Nocardioides sp. TaxID=35761 RepID=UPI002EDA5623